MEKIYVTVECRYFISDFLKDRIRIYFFKVYQVNPFEPDSQFVYSNGGEGPDRVEGSHQTRQHQRMGEQGQQHHDALSKP